MATTLPLQENQGRPTTLPPRQAALLSATRVEQKGNIIVKWITSTDHKTIGYMYLIASVLFFMLGGVMALIIRAELFEPGMQIVPTKEQYNQLFTMHGTIMLLMFATPLFAGFANAHHAPADRRTRRRVPATERLRVLAVPLRLDHRGRRLPHPRGRCGLRLVRVPAPGGRELLARTRRQPVDARPRHERFRHDPRRRELHHDDHHDARSRHDHVADADLLVEHAGHQHPDPDGVPGPRGRDPRRCGRPHPRRPHLRPGERRRAALAAPVLVLRPPRGVHHRAAVLRHHLRGHPGLQPQADLRLQDPRLRDDRDRRAVRGGVGAPHVRHRRGAAAVLRPDDDADRGAHRA